jgi:hypothetical protein
MREAPKRRWFQFSLRTLFVVITVTAIGCAALRAHNWSVRRQTFLESGACLASSHTDDHHAPLPLRLMGEQGYLEIRVGLIGTFDVPLSAEQENEVERIRQLFPEAQVDGHVWREPPVNHGK